MGVVIHLIRHAQGVHNLCVENEAIPDPNLTDLGYTQCSEARASFPHHDKITHLVASPMRRTLQTALLTFGPESDDDYQRTALLPVTAQPNIQEVSDNPCDIGSDVPTVEREFKGRVDFSLVPADWNAKLDTTSPFEPTVEKVEARALKARKWLRDLAKRSTEKGVEEVHIVAVSHGEFLHFLTEEFHNIPPKRATSWRNCEYRSYQFEDPTGQDPMAMLTETQESWKSRLGEASRPSADELAEMRRTFYREFEPLMKVERPANDGANGAA